MRFNRRSSLVLVCLCLLALLQSQASRAAEPPVQAKIEVLIDDQVVVQRALADLPTTDTKCADLVSVRDKDTLLIRFTPGDDLKLPPRLQVLRVPDSKKQPLTTTDVAALAAAPTDQTPAMVTCRTLSLDSGETTVALKDVECSGKGDLRNGGAIVIPKAEKLEADRILICIDDTWAPIVGDDIGVAFNTLDRTGDREKSRYFGGASLYASLFNLYSDRVRLVGNFSAVDFAEDVELETGVGLGLVFRFNPDQNPEQDEGSFTLSATYGYNLMEDKDPRYLLIGFGWSFGQ